MQLGALLDSSNTKRIGWRFVERGSIDWRAAVAAEGVNTLGSAFGGFDVGLRLASDQHESLGWRRDVGAISRTGQGLAVGTVANANSVRVNLCLIGDIAAMTAAFNPHGSLQ